MTSDVMKSGGVNVSSNASTNSEIDRLTAEVEKRRGRAEFWDTWNIRLLWIAGIVAVSLAITGVGVSRSNKKLLEVSDELDKTKGRVLQSDLKSKDRDIATLNDHAASLELKALALQKELLAQGPRYNMLLGERRQKLISALIGFPNQRIDIRRNAFVVEVNGKPVSSTPIGDDTVGFSTALIPFFKEAGWNALSREPGLSNFMGKGILVGITASAPEKTKAAATALVAAFSRVPFSVDGPIVLDESRFRRIGEDAIVPPLDSTTIVLEILSRE